MKLSNWFEQCWYGEPKPFRQVILRPLSWLYILLTVLRRKLYQLGIFLSDKPPVLTIIVGNITTGGTGKTPVVHAIVSHLKQLGLQPGIVSRGYGGRTRGPLFVEKHHDAHLVGDEALLLAQSTNVPVVVAKNRLAAAHTILENTQCNCIVSDDGLQHYALGRDIEVVLLDGNRGLGNGLRLPAGPLRESKARLKAADFILTKRSHPADDSFYYAYGELLNLKSGDKKPLSAFKGITCHGIAGVSHPEPFFDCLEAAGLKLKRHHFPDHHPFSPSDLNFEDDNIIIMTEKDRVKISEFATQNMWVLPIKAILPQGMLSSLTEKVSLSI